MSENPSDVSKSLITQLEEEMLKDVREIDVAAADEDKIDFSQVWQWYVETEKLLRVIGNLFSSPLTQSINQLRYAGHHILKANVDTDAKTQKQNLLEAYKHCKRAFYDALDFYIYKLSEDYRSLLPHLDGQNASELEGILKVHIQEIQNARLESVRRIEYYTKVQSTLIKGLTVIESINKIQRATGIASDLRTDKKTLRQDNASLSNHIKALQDRNELLSQKLDSKLYLTTLLITVIIAAATAVGLIADAFLTSNHQVTISNSPGPRQDEASTQTLTPLLVSPTTPGSPNQE